jgi:hypothetical protein
MGALFSDLGFIRWPMTFSLLAVFALSAWSAWRLLIAGAADMRQKAWIDAILFWGGFALVSGVLGTLVRIILAAQRIEASGSIETVLLWGGIKVALLISALGVMILCLAAIFWFLLQLRWRLLVAKVGR